MQTIRFDSCGEPVQVLKCCDQKCPEPGAGEVLVRMLASPVNPSDLMFIRGRYTTIASCPATPGFEGVGVVVKSGGGLRGRIFVGRRVVVLNRLGGNWAEYAVVPADQVIPVSSKLTDEQAATFFVNPATAWVMTQEVLKVPKNAWLLQTAASSSLGRMVIRLGKSCGFRTFNLVRRDSQIAALRKLGADHVEVYDSEKHSMDNLYSSVQQLVGKSGIRYAIDAVGGDTASAIIRCLGPDGHLLLYGTLSNADLQFSPRTLMTVGSRVEGFWLGKFMNGVSLPFKLLLIRRITGLIRDGVLASTIRRTIPLDQITEAVTAAEDSSQEGKILLRIQGT